MNADKLTINWQNFAKVRFQFKFAYHNTAHNTNNTWTFNS